MTRIPTALVVLALGGIVAGCGPSKKDLQAELDKVRDQLSQAQGQNQSLEQKISELQKEVTAQNARLDELIEERSLTEGELAELRAAQKAREEELSTYKQLFARLKKLIDAGTIKVVFRKGKMMVEMDSAVLFDSGKAELRDNGKAALDEITQALLTVGDRDFLVAGHTDNLPIKRRFKSNWELSAQRAIGVVNYMMEKGFPGANIGAAGFGEHDPVGDNNTEEGRAENRRIEIILMPNLGEIKGMKEMLEGKEEA
jgi:chemotaxis protein MotB